MICGAYFRADDEGKSPTLAEKMMTLYRTGQYVEPRYATSDELRRVDVGVATVDMELDAPDDVIGVVAEESGVQVELVDAETLAKLSDASLDRIASERAMQARSPAQTSSQTPSYVAPVQSLPSCAAPCATDECLVPMTAAAACCDPSPCARCSQSLDRVGVVCPTPCDGDVVCPSAAGAGDRRVSQTDEMCQTEPTAGSSSRGTSRASSRASSLATGTETSETDFDQLYSTDDANDDTGKQAS